jgi:hypothetical protein
MKKFILKEFRRVGTRPKIYIKVINVKEIIGIFPNLKKYDDRNIQMYIYEYPYESDHIYNQFIESANEIIERANDLGEWADYIEPENNSFKYHVFSTHFESIY